MFLILDHTVGSRLGFLINGCTISCFHPLGSTPEDRLLLITARTGGPKVEISPFNKWGRMTSDDQQSQIKSQNCVPTQTLFEKGRLKAPDFEYFYGASHNRTIQLTRLDTN